MTETTLKITMFGHKRIPSRESGIEIVVEELATRIHTIGVFIFGCTGFLILPFVRVFTNGISDANYVVPLFAALITVAHAFHCVRIPYNTMILAAGHYKQTQSNYIVAAFLNVFISIITVKAFGLIGVAIGTLIAMAYQAVWMAFYVSKNLLELPINGFVKQLLADVLTVSLIFVISRGVHLNGLSYFDWGVMALKISAVVCVCIIFVNLIFYRDRMFFVTERICEKLGHKI